MKRDKRTALLNGLLAWFVGLALYMIPAFIVAFRLAFELGSQRQDSSVIRQQISHTISTMYAGSWQLQVGFIVIVGLLVVWRSWVVVKENEEKQLVSGFIVGVVPAVLMLLFLACGGFGWLDIIAMLVCLVAGAAGGYLAKVQIR
jgi:hypothetical protein